MAAAEGGGCGHRTHRCASTERTGAAFARRIAIGGDDEPFMLPPPLDARRSVPWAVPRPAAPSALPRPSSSVALRVGCSPRLDQALAELSVGDGGARDLASETVPAVISKTCRDHK